MIYWFTGQPGAGKTVLANMLKKELPNAFRIDGDEMRDLFTNKEDIEKNIYDGYVFDKIERKDGMYQYIVYLHEMKMVSRITMRENKNNYEKMSFKIYLFQDQDTLRKKIRLQPIII